MTDYAPKGVRETSTQIVQNYLDMLLSNLPNFEPEAAPAPPQMLPDAQTRETSATTRLPQAPAVRDALADLTPQIESEPQISPSAGMYRVQAGKEQSPRTSESSADWRNRDFASLLFDVAGVQLAAPLCHLGGISALSTPLQTVAGQADWFLGLMRWNGRNMRVIDTARLIMPERVAAVGASEYQAMVVLGDTHWALAANEVIESLTLAPGDVKWRTGSARRPWLSGMLAQRLCVLMDVGHLIRMLDEHSP